MKTISQYLLLPLLMSLTAFSATGDDSNPAALAFEQMKTLVGYWKRQDANNTKFKIHFEGTSINCLWRPALAFGLRLAAARFRSRRGRKQLIEVPLS